MFFDFLYTSEGSSFGELDRARFGGKGKGCGKGSVVPIVSTLPVSSGLSVFWEKREALHLQMSTPY